MDSREDIIFALDIGTRTVVGTVLKSEADELNLIASEVVEHKNRSMLDGQIHNVIDVANQVKKIKNRLEEKCDLKLNKVGIAAAGRALKTVKGHHEIEFKNKKEISPEDVKMLEFAAVQDAQKKLAVGKDKEKASGYHFVGYTLLGSKLDGIEVGSLISQRGKKIEIDLIATFLPRIVVDSLLTVIRQADLEVDHLTLEPIAAANIIVPQQMYNFNLALVDIGAGTSDIAITRDGAIIGYDMVPVAGDEITEAICENYMVDYHTAETIKRKLNSAEEVEMKDILDQKVKISTQSIIKNIEDKINNLAKLIAEAILRLNGRAPQAVICIGGGSLTPLLREKLSQYLELPVNRVGVKDGEEIQGVRGKIKDISGTQSITPFGIAMSCKKNQTRANFIDIELNDNLIHLFTLTPPKVSDALLAAELDIKALKASPGLAMSVEVNGNLKMIPGTMGTPAKVFINGEEAGIDSEIKNGDKVDIELGEKGKNGSGLIKDVVPELPARKIFINGEAIELDVIYYLNGEKVNSSQELSDGDKISYTIPQTVEDVIRDVIGFPIENLRFNKINYSLNGQDKEYKYQNYKIKVNDKAVSLDKEVDEGDKISFVENNFSNLKIKDVLGDLSEQSMINIVFNEKAIKVPAKDYKLLKNNKPAKLDDIIQQGDEIEYQSGGIRLNQVLEHINYQIPRSLGGKLIIEKNNQKAQLIEALTDGDRVKVYIENNK
ncbi:cell division protein FtsA [Orenia marismortui]|uniref:Cell division protein FtsA n=1 Tax=Orenia marismortui TaxID=46469 RepID=A0A4R8H0C5_9FIRM|nr:cell division FtsA domain-containing protein [Orenia marismortui]TDX48414.1 cell division protein FtsA [Orenia marismortui]